MRAHRLAADRGGDPTEELVQRARSAPACRPFRAALASGGAVIAEIKRRSPSKGDLAPHLAPGVLAKAYEVGGAACVSVLTDVEYFGARPGDLAEARAACDLPVLRKDFTVSERDVYEARAMGADAVLLIVSALDDRELARFLELVHELGFAALVEVHTEPELDRALAAGADIVGVNQRDLDTFAVESGRATSLRAGIPADVVAVAESGIRDAQDAHELFAAGYDAILVGESLVTAPDPTAAVRALKGAP